MLQKHGCFAIVGIRQTLYDLRERGMLYKPQFTKKKQKNTPTSSSNTAALRTILDEIVALASENCLGLENLKCRSKVQICNGQ